MKKLVLLVLLASNAAFAGSTECSNAQGTIRFSTWSYSGGPAPAPGMVMSRTSWSYRDTVVFSEETRLSCEDAPFGCPAEEIQRRTVSSTFRGEFDGASRVTIEQGPVSPTPLPYGFEIYAIQARLSRTDGTPVFADRPDTEIREFFICRYDWALLP